MSKAYRYALPALTVLSLAPLAHAAIEGAVSANEYNLTLATQTVQTGFGNNFSELNQAFARLSPDGQLQLGLTGNLETNGNGLVIFIDSRAGGAIGSTTAGGYGVVGSVGGAKTDDWGTDLDGSAGTQANAGSVLSPGFNPDYSLEINAGGGGPNYYINAIDLHVPNDPVPNRDIFLPDPADNSRSGTFGGGAVTSTYTRDTGAAGTVTYAFDNTNTAGVNGNGDPTAGDPTTATTGFEALFSTLFLNADPGQDIKLLAFITSGGGDYLSNQFLPGLPTGTGNLGGPGGDGGTPLFDAEHGFAAGLPNFYMTVPLPEWGVAGSGTWSTDANWLVTRPDGVNTTAKFGAAISADATVTVDGNHTVGGIIFDNALHSYTLGGSGTLTLEALAGKTARLNVVSGNHMINTPITMNTSTRITVPTSNTLTIGGAVTAAAGVDLTKDGGGTVLMNNVRVGAVAVVGGTVKVKASGTANATSGTSVMTSLSINVPGVIVPTDPKVALDLTNNSAVINYTGATPQTPVRLLLQSGLANGNGIVTSSATANTRLGYAEASVVLGPTGGTFAGQTVDNTSILIKYTYGGDTNLDGKVDVADLGALATSWQTSGVWTNGDSDYSGFIDVADLGILSTNWQKGVTNPPPLGPSLAAALAALGLPQVSVPEPTSVALIGLAATSLIRRRRRD